MLHSQQEIVLFPSRGGSDPRRSDPRGSTPVGVRGPREEVLTTTPQVGGRRAQQAGYKRTVVMCLRRLIKKKTILGFIWRTAEA